MFTARTILLAFFMAAAANAFSVQPPRSSTALFSSVGDNLDAAKKAAGQVGENIQNKVEGDIETTKSAAKDADREAKSKADSAASDAKSAASDAADKAKGAVDDAKDVIN